MDHRNGGIVDAKTVGGLMTRYVAFLGGINVGGHRPSMERLRAEFEALGLADVSTFIASGNVIFSTRATARTLEPRIEAHLGDQLGYGVPTFVRTDGELAKAVALAPFGAITPPDTHVIAFLRCAPAAAARSATAALSNHQDRFEVHGKELHWLIHGGVSDSSVKTSLVTKTVGQPFTMRNTKSLRKLAALLAG
jgi:uncharacterized protein (DUF1697 family)